MRILGLDQSSLKNKEKKLIDNDIEWRKNVEAFQLMTKDIQITSNFEMERYKLENLELENINEQLQGQMKKYQKQQPLIQVLRDEVFR